ncbi:hypothetical protein V1279_002999 [Bradyrhizobium sp. AZCC 1610]|uniref:hypothetical protein n=1 Tax=Bradyrhizobium sp. AZCC 1610 TaxID=3117020 RepID=UPI002FEF59F2
MIASGSGGTCRTFEEFQARIRASARIVTEADLYWRANRWDPDLARALDAEIMVKSCSSLFKSNKSNPPEVGRIYRR